MNARNESAHERIAAHFRQRIDSGDLRAGDRLPTNRQIMSDWGVSTSTVAAAMRSLTDLNYVIGTPGRGTEVLPAEARAENWPLTGRYARARRAGDLVFSPDVDATVVKQTVSKAWVTQIPVPLANLMDMKPSTRMFRRESRTYVDGQASELTAMYFPPSVVEAAPALETADSIKVVELVEQAGMPIEATRNRIDGRPASIDERDLLALDEGDWVYVHTHATLSGGVPVEGVVNVKPQRNNALTFTTDERPLP